MNRFILGLPVKQLNNLSVVSHQLRLPEINALLFSSSVNFQNLKLRRYYHGHCKHIKPTSNKINNVLMLDFDKIGFGSKHSYLCWPHSIALDHSKRLSTYRHGHAVELLTGTSFGKQINNCRNKSTKKPQKRLEYDSDTDSDVEEDLPRGTKVATFRLQSLRMDGLLKKSLNITRNKVETVFYEGNIRINGRKADKKSFQLRIGDEVDFIKGPSLVNPEHLNVSRIEVVSVNEDGDDADELLVKVKISKNLTIENYESHPWKPSGSSE